MLDTQIILDYYKHESIARRYRRFRRMEAVIENQEKRSLHFLGEYPDKVRKHDYEITDDVEIIEDYIEEA